MREKVDIYREMAKSLLGDSGKAFYAPYDDVSVANSEDNLMPSIIEAVRNKCTLGEIADALRECFGEFNQS